MLRMKIVLATAALLGCVTATAASAMPIAPISANTGVKVEQVRVVCGPYRCWWRPNYYHRHYYGAYGYYPGHRYYWRHRYWRHRYW